MGDQRRKESTSSGGFKQNLANLDAGRPVIFVTEAPKPNPKVSLCLQLTFITLMATINVMCLVVGSLHYHECSVQPGVSLYLILKGSVGIMDIPSFALQQALLSRNSPRLGAVFLLNAFRSLLCLTNFALLIFGSVVVYEIYPPNYDQTNGEAYCNKFCYLLAFTVVTYMWSVLALTLLCFCCALPFFCLYCQAVYGLSRAETQNQEGGGDVTPGARRTSNNK